MYGGDRNKYHRCDVDQGNLRTNLLLASPDPKSPKGSKHKSFNQNKGAT
jgi:hypothetical protein